MKRSILRCCHVTIYKIDKISRLITKEAHQCGHPGVATTVAKTRTKYSILRVHDLAKTVKFKCVTCREMEPKTEMHIMADLPNHRTAPDSPPFYYMSCNYFAGLEITAGQQTMSGLIVDLTAQTFVLLVMLTGQNSIVLKMK